jgi:hypothetical protein
VQTIIQAIVSRVLRGASLSAFTAGRQGKLVRSIVVEIYGRSRRPSPILSPKLLQAWTGVYLSAQNTRSFDPGRLRPPDYLTISDVAEWLYKASITTPHSGSAPLPE